MTSSPEISAVDENSPTAHLTYIVNSRPPSPQIFDSLQPSQPESVQLRHSTGVIRPPKWQTSDDDVVLY